MTATYDLTTDIGTIRNLIRDTDTAAAFFTDEELQSFLTLNSNNVRRAAAEALDSWANDEAMVQKAIKLLDISTNGPAVAKVLQAHAAQLRQLADDEDDDPGFDIAEMALGTFSWREQIINEAIRDA